MISSHLHARRPGMTLPEVLTALVLMGIIGAAVTGVFVSQSQLHDQQEKHSAARAASSSAVNMIMSELRMLERSGSVVSATASVLEVEAPFAFGIVCTSAAGSMIVSRLPGDTMLFNSTISTNSYSSHAALDRVSGSYTPANATSNPVPVSALVSGCANAPLIRVFTAAEGGGTFTLVPGITWGGVPVPRGTPIMMRHRVRYEFKASTLVPGQIGLFRKVGSGSTPPEEEIAAPFAASARFRFYVNDATAAQDAPPGTFNQITGLELILDGVARRPAPDGTLPVLPYSTSVFFRNRL